MKTFASLFSGFGLADIGAIQAGLEPIWGVEIDPQIAEVAKFNLKHDIHAKDILDCNPVKFDRPDVLWASPPCPSFSQAKVNGKETELDQRLAIKVVDFLKAMKPPVFILENVSGYARSKSLEFIEGALYALGYWIDRQVLNSADFGVPQTRKRLILRAVLGGFPQPLPAPTKWMGWYEAIEDLIPTLPETQFADWQLKRLPDELIQSCLVDVGNTIRDCTVRNANEPSITVTAEKMRRPASTPRAFLLNRNQTEWDDYFRKDDRPSYTVCAEGSCGRSRAFLVPGGNASSFSIRMAEEPSRTIGDVDRVGNISRAFIVDGQNARSPEKGGINLREKQEPVFTVSGSNADRRAWLEQGKVVSMTSRALARFQSMPDTYELPEKNTLACRGIGNGVPCKFAEGIIRSTVA